MPYKCLNCGKIVKGELGKDQMPICQKKKCIKFLAEVFSRLCKDVDEQVHNDTDGFIIGKDLIRFDHFNGDFEKHWKKMKDVAS